MQVQGVAPVHGTSVQRRHRRNPLCSWATERTYGGGENRRVSSREGDANYSLTSCG